MEPPSQGQRSDPAVSVTAVRLIPGLAPESPLVGLAAAHESCHRLYLGLLEIHAKERGRGHRTVAPTRVDLPPHVDTEASVKFCVCH